MAQPATRRREARKRGRTRSTGPASATPRPARRRGLEGAGRAQQAPQPLPAQRQRREGGRERKLHPAGGARAPTMWWRPRLPRSDARQGERPGARSQEGRASPRRWRSGRAPEAPAAPRWPQGHRARRAPPHSATLAGDGSSAARGEEQKLRPSGGAPTQGRPQRLGRRTGLGGPRLASTAEAQGQEGTASQRNAGRRRQQRGEGRGAEAPPLRRHTGTRCGGGRSRRAETRGREAGASGREGRASPRRWRSGRAPEEPAAPRWPQGGRARKAPSHSATPAGGRRGRSRADSPCPTRRRRLSEGRGRAVRRSRWAAPRLASTVDGGGSAAGCAGTHPRRPEAASGQARGRAPPSRSRPAAAPQEAPPLRRRAEEAAGREAGPGGPSLTAHAGRRGRSGSDSCCRAGEACPRLTRRRRRSGGRGAEAPPLGGAPNEGGCSDSRRAEGGDASRAPAAYRPGSGAQMPGHAQAARRRGTRGKRGRATGTGRLPPLGQTGPPAHCATAAAEGGA